MKKILVLSVVCMFFTSYLHAQLTSSNFIFADNVPTPSSYSTTGWNGNDYSSSTTYNLSFGTTGDEVVGIFYQSGIPWDQHRLGNPPYDRVVINRVDNTNVTGNNKQTMFFQQGVNIRKFEATYTGTMENALNSRTINRGMDNAFANSGSETMNNVERIDMILDAGYAATNPTKRGILILERGGNDDFKVAAIKSLDNSGNPSSYGTLYTVDASADMGNTGLTYETSVFQINSSSLLKPDQILSTQNIYGVFLTLDQLNILGSETIYGISIFPADVNSTNDLIGLTDVPTSTDGSSNSVGGLDLAGGSGFYSDPSDDEPFPISLLDFSASNQDNANRLSWSTATEINNDYFEVQRSTNGEIFTTIGTVEGSGNTNEVKKYKFSDYTKSTGIVYYRLKQVDYNGEYEFFGPVAVNPETTDNDMNVYPNPNNGVFSISGLNDTNTEILIMNNTGQIVYKEMVSEENIRIDLSELSSGIYFIKTVQNDQVTTKRFSIK